jgi:hypothetical protein
LVFRFKSITCTKRGFRDPDGEHDRVNPLGDRCDLNGGEREDASNERCKFGAISRLEDHHPSLGG